MKRKALSTLLLVTLLSSAIALPVAAETELTPITFCRTADPLVESNVFANLEGATYESNIWTDLIAERLGYEVSYLWVASSDEIAKQKFNAAIAAGTIPDVVCVSKQDLKQLVDGDLVIDIAPYFEEYASDYLKELIDAAGTACIDASTYNGVQYGIPYVDCDLEKAQILWLRQDWLSALNLEAPETLDQLKEIISAFMEYAGEGSVGMALSNDLYGNQFDIKGWSNAYGAYPGYWIEGEDGNLVYGSTTQEMKEALGGLAELYAEGMIDPEFYVYDNEKASEALVNGKCGVLYGFHASSLDYLQRVINADPDADWMPYMIPMEEEGQIITPGIEMCTSNWYAVSKDCEHPEALIEMLNLYCEKVLDPDLNEYDVYANPGDGVEGVWKLSPVTYSGPDKNQVTTQAISEALKTGDPGDLSGEQYSMWEYSYAAQNGDRTMWGWNRVFGANGSQELLIEYQNRDDVELVYDKFVAAPGEIMSERKTTLDDMLDQTFIKIISGQETLDAFDQIVEQWTEAGGQEMTDEVNEWYNANK
jgi:putative aldouronate transport system substrate-binding protein